MHHGGFENRGMRAIGHIGQGFWIDIGIDAGNGIFQWGSIQQGAFSSKNKTDNIRHSGGGKGSSQAGCLRESRQSGSQ